MMLQHFGYLTTLVDADGIYSDLVMQAVQRFQVCLQIYQYSLPLLLFGFVLDLPQ